MHQTSINNFYLKIINEMMGQKVNIKNEKPFCGAVSKLYYAKAVVVETDSS